MVTDIFAAIRRFFRDLGLGEAPEEAEEEFPPDDHRVAVAALGVHAIRIDGLVEDAERAKLYAVLQAKFDLADDETERLIEVARERDRQAVDLYAFTSVVKKALDEDGRKNVVELLWALAYADGQVHELEDNFVWRVAELLGVSSRDRIRMRKRAAGRAEASGEDE